MIRSCSTFSRRWFLQFLLIITDVWCNHGIGHRWWWRGYFIWLLLRFVRRVILLANNGTTVKLLMLWVIDNDVKLALRGRIWRRRDLLQRNGDLFLSRLMFHTGHFLPTDGPLRGDSRGIRRGLLLVDFIADFQINWLFWLLRGLGRLRGCNNLLKETQLGVPL